MHKKLRKVVFLTDHHLCFNPRVWKEAFFYEKRGVAVVVLSMWTSRVFLERDEKLLKGHSIVYKTYLNLIPGEAGVFFRFFYRLRKKIAGALQRFTGIGFPAAISYAPTRMAKYAFREKADLYAAHLECAFFAGKKLIRKGMDVSFDFEDWYANDFLVPERPVKLLRSLEKSALEKGLFCTCTSEVMKIALKDFYDSTGPQEIIYNGFSIEETVNPLSRSAIGKGNPLRLIWFSRSIGPERGIETFLEALTLAPFPVEVGFLGKMEPGFDSVLESLGRGKRFKLNAYPFIDHAKLPGFITEYDIALALDIPVNRNREVTITNKILQYLQAGLPILASDTPGHREVAGYFPEKVKVVNLYEPAEVVDAVLDLKKMKPGLNVEEQRRFDAIFSWEAQEKKLETVLRTYYEF